MWNIVSRRCANMHKMSYDSPHGCKDTSNKCNYYSMKVLLESHFMISVIKIP